MSLREYNMLMRAVNLREVDRDYDLHRSAWLNVQAGAMKQQGKRRQVPVYKTFKSFYDYEAQLRKARGETNSQFKELSRHLKEKRDVTHSGSDPDRNG